MKITSIRIQQKFSKGDIVALATIEIDHYFIICDIKVIRDSNSKLIDVPAYTDENGDHTMVVMSDNELIKNLGQAIMAAYNDFVKGLALQKAINKK